MIHHGEEFVLGDARLDRITHRCDRGLRPRHADLQAFDFLRRLDGARAENLALAVAHVEPLAFEGERVQMAAAVEADLPRSRRMAAHQIGDLGGERPRGLAVLARNG